MVKAKIVLEEEEERELNRWLRASTVSVRDRQRAQIILLRAEGHAQEAIGAKAGVARVPVNHWCQCFIKERPVHGCPRAWPQAFATRYGAQESAGDSNAPTRQPGMLELSHYSASGRHLDGQRTMLEGSKRHQAAPDQNL